MIKIAYGIYDRRKPQLINMIIYYHNIINRYNFSPRTD